MEYLPKVKTEVMWNIDWANWAQNCLQTAATQVWSDQYLKWSWYETQWGKLISFLFCNGGSLNLFHIYSVHSTGSKNITPLDAALRTESIAHFCISFECSSCLQSDYTSSFCQRGLSLQWASQWLNPKSWLQLSLFWGHFAVNIWMLVHELAMSVYCW